MSAPDRGRRIRRATHTPEIAGHARPRGALRSVRVQILAPVLVAAIGVATLGLIQVNQSLTEVSQSNRASALAEAVRPIGALAHALALEYIYTTDARRRGGPTAELTAQRADTDSRRAEFTVLSGAIRASAPQLDPLVTGVERSVRSLDTAREILVRAPDGSTEVRAFYDGILVSLLALVEGIPAQLSDAHLSELARSVAILANLDRTAALQLEVVARALTARQISASEYTQLAQLMGSEQAQLTALSNLHPAAELTAASLGRVVVTTAASIRQTIVDSRGEASGLNSDPGTWSTAQTRRLEGIWAIEGQLSVSLTDQARVLGSAARDRVTLVGGLALVIVAVTIAGATIMAVRISRRLRRTRYAALTAARVELPSAIANVIAAHDANTVRSALNDSSNRIDAMLGAGPDEIGELSTAFGPCTGRRCGSPPTRPCCGSRCRRCSSRSPGAGRR